MKNISESDLTNFIVDNKARKEFLKTSFRYEGPGGILFLVAILVLVYDGINLRKEVSIGIFIIAFLGFSFEYYIHLKARKKAPQC